MESNKKQWGSHFGFLMAAVGSAVGLGNLWGFPYKMGSHGGFAFLVIYLVLAVFVGYVIMMGELTIGRRSGKGAIGAYKEISEKYAIVGWMAYICPYLILSFYSMLGGWCLRYAVANIGNLFDASWGTAGQDSGTFFTNLYLSQSTSTIYTVIFIVLTALIVMGGVSGGIEKFSKYAMPALFFMLIIVIIRSVTLPGAVEGLKFMFKPDFSVFQGMGWLSVLASAGGQMFFSLSLGMGIMITYGAYLPKETSIEKSSLIIPACDTLIALMAGVAVMPAVFAFGMEPGGGPGLLFVTLQAVFAEMGAIGPVFGFILYFLVFIAAITSSISLLEVSTAVLTDRAEAKGQVADRKKITLINTAIVLVLGIFVSLDGLGTYFPQILGQPDWLDSFDLISEGILMPLGALITSLILGWGLGGDWLEEEIAQNGNKFSSKGFTVFCLRFIAPIGMVLILAGQINSFFGLEWF